MCCLYGLIGVLSKSLWCHVLKAGVGPDSVIVGFSTFRSERIWKQVERRPSGSLV